MTICQFISYIVSRIHLSWKSLEKLFSLLNTFRFFTFSTEGSIYLLCLHLPKQSLSHWSFLLAFCIVRRAFAAPHCYVHCTFLFKIYWEWCLCKSKRKLCGVIVFKRIFANERKSCLPLIVFLQMQEKVMCLQ